jgi:hypothetical protein
MIADENQAQLTVKVGLPEQYFVDSLTMLTDAAGLNTRGFWDKEMSFARPSGRQAARDREARLSSPSPR